MTVETLLVPLDGTVLPSKEEIGGKAWSIARMRRLGLPVPPAVVLPVSACRDFHAGGERLSGALWDAARRGVRILEDETGRSFGSGPRPLLLSVRSGAPVSMPGMMDTVLDLGINAETEAALAAESGDLAYARDTHARFVEAYGRIVCRADLGEAPERDPDALRERVLADTAERVPDDPWEQLRGAVTAVFRSWNSRRARAYRKHWDIPDDGGTAVTLQAMVFGNVDDRSGTGVLFTRNPISGAAEPYGEYLPRAQGEDVVSGSRTPLPLNALREKLPEVHSGLIAAGRVLERESGDVQDIEFTVERGRLFLLQSRSAKRSAQAAVRVAVDLVRDGVLTPEQAVRRVTADQVRALLRPAIDAQARERATRLLRGEPASPGVAGGTVVSGSAAAEAGGAAGRSVVLAAPTTSPEDVPGMLASVAVLTETGGSTSHAAVVTRALGRPCVVGCGPGSLGALIGRDVTVDGETGEVFEGALPLRRISGTDHPDLAALHDWATGLSPLRVLGPHEAGAGVVDLDAREVVDAGDLDRALTGVEAATGQVLTTDEGVRAAVRAGVRVIVVDEPLPALLAAIGAERAG